MNALPQSYTKYNHVRTENHRYSFPVYRTKITNLHVINTIHIRNHIFHKKITKLYAITENEIKGRSFANSKTKTQNPKSIYLTASDDVEMFGQDVDELAFPFITPLTSQNCRDLTQRFDPVQTFAGRCSHQRRGWRNGLHRANDDISVANKRRPLCSRVCRTKSSRNGIWIEG